MERMLITFLVAIGLITAGALQTAKREHQATQPNSSVQMRSALDEPASQSISVRVVEQY